MLCSSIQDFVSYYQAVNEHLLSFERATKDKLLRRLSMSSFQCANVVAM